MSRRGQIQMNDDEVRSFLEEERTVICATNGVRGFPHLMPLWYVLRNTGPDDGLEIWAWTFGKSQKIKNLERDARATLQVEAGTEYHLLRGVMLETEVELVSDVEQVTQLGLEITARYGGDLAASSDEAKQLIAAQAAKRVAMRFVERKRATWDHRKLGGVY